MNANSRRVVWTEKAVLALKEHIAFLEKRSPAAAARVSVEILSVTKSLTTMAEMFQLDEYRNNRDQNIRRFFRWHYKIVYEVYEFEVVILNIIHTAKMSQD